MKRVLSITIALISFALTSCDKECDCTYSREDPDTKEVFTHTETIDISGTGTNCSDLEDDFNEDDGGWVCN